MFCFIPGVCNFLHLVSLVAFLWLIFIIFLLSLMHHINVSIFMNRKKQLISKHRLTCINTSHTAGVKINSGFFDKLYKSWNTLKSIFAGFCKNLIFLSLLSVSAIIYATEVLQRSTCEEPHGFVFITVYCDIIRTSSIWEEDKLSYRRNKYKKNWASDYFFESHSQSFWKSQPLLLMLLSVTFIVKLLLSFLCEVLFEWLFR